MRRPIASITLLILTIASVVWVMPAVHAQTETIIFTAQLLAGNEVFPVAVNPTEAGTLGFATVTMTVTRTGGAITAASSRFDVTLSGMGGTSVIILTHIHQGGASVNGPVVVDSGLSPAAPVPTSGGAAGFTRSGLTTSNTIAQAIIDNPGGFYFNVHTALSPGGVARGQLVRQQQATPGAAAPTLSEWGAILMALLMIAASMFFLVGRRKESLEPAGGPSSAAFERPARTIHGRLLVKVTLCVEAAISVALVGLSAGVTDAVGALASGLVFAFIVHILIAAARRR